MAHLRQQARVQLRSATPQGPYVSAATGQDDQGRLTLATATSYGAVLVWDVEAEQISNVVWTDAGESRVAMARDADGRAVLATVSTRQRNGVIRLWDAYEGRLRLAVDGNGADVIALGLGERGRLLIAGGGTTDGLVYVWDGTTGQLRCTLAGHVGVRRATLEDPAAVSIDTTSLPSARALAFSPRGRLLASGGEDGVRLWDPSDGRALGVLPAGPGGVESLAFGATTHGPLILAAGGVDGLIRVWAADSGQLLHTLVGHEGRPVQVALGEDAEGRLLLGSSGPEATIRIWEAMTGAARHVVGPRMKPPTAVVSLPGSLATLPSWAVTFGTATDGRLLLTSSDGDGRARAYDAATGELRHTLVGSVPSARAVALGVGGAGRLLLVVGDDRGTLHRFDALTGEATGTVELGQWISDRLALDVDDQGRTLLASSSFSGVIRVLELETGAIRWQLQGDDRGDWTKVAMGHGPDGGLLLASAGADRMVRIWDLRRGRLLSREVRTAPVWSVAIGTGFSGRAVLVTGDADGLVRVQDPVDLAPRHVLTGSDRRVLCVATGSDEAGEALIAAGDETGLVLVWGLGSGRPGPAVTGRGHTGEVRSMTFYLDGDGHTRLATVATDQTLRIWDPTTGAEVDAQPLDGAPYSVAAGTTADGIPVLAVALSTGAVTVWRWPGGERRDPGR